MLKRREKDFKSQRTKTFVCEINNAMINNAISYTPKVTNVIVSTCNEQG